MENKVSTSWKMGYGAHSLHSRSLSFSRRTTAPRMKQMEYTDTPHQGVWGTMGCRYREGLLKKAKMTPTTKVSSTFSRPGMVADDVIKIIPVRRKGHIQGIKHRCNAGEGSGSNGPVLVRTISQKLDICNGVDDRD